MTEDTIGLLTTKSKRENIHPQFNVKNNYKVLMYNRHVPSSKYKIIDQKNKCFSGLTRITC